MTYRMTLRERKQTRLMGPGQLAAILLAALGLVCMFLPRFPAASVWIAENVAPKAVGALALVTGWIPFSLGGLIVMLLPPAGIVFAVFAVRAVVRSRRKGRTALRLALFVAGLLGTISLVFFLSFGSCYYRQPLDARMGLVRADVSAAQLEAAASYMLERANALSAEVEYTAGGGSAMPYNTYPELTKHVLAGYDAVFGDLLPKLSAPAKPVIFSEAMSYLGITGFFFPFTGEASINAHYPDWDIPFTVGHELAHQRGVAREEEANFAGVLVTIASDEPYIRYSGYLSAYIYLSNALWRADVQAAEALAARRSDGIRAELAAQSAYSAAHDTTVRKVSQNINNSYLQSNGQTAGVASYGYVADLLVAWYEEELAGQ